MQLNKLAKLFLLTLCVGIGSCTKSEMTNAEVELRGIEVGFEATAHQTRTSIGEDGITTSWSKGDKVAMWAVNSEGTYALENQTFNLYFRDLPSTSAFFTSTLGSAMSEGDYTYYATYPTPKAVSGTTATFTVPSMQDGTISGGAAVMVAEPAQGSALTALTHTPGDYEVNNDGLSLKMNHALHALRLYIPESKWGFAEGESIEQIVITMPNTIAGDYTLDFTNALPMSVENGTNKIYVTPAKELKPSTYPSEYFAAVSVIPFNGEFMDEDVITIKTLTQSQYAETEISLAGHGAMEAGHITPVSIDCSEVHALPRILFRIASNNLGEQPYRITLTSADSDSKWTTATGHEYSYYTGSTSKTIANGNGFDIAYDLETIASISGKQVTVTYETPSAIVTEFITMPTMTPTEDNTPDYIVSLTLPYLFEEDFSTLQVYDGDYTDGPYTSASGASTSARDLSQYGLSAGWSGARTGCDAAGVAILVSGRVDCVIAGATRAYGRLDSPAMSKIKPGVRTNVKVSFTYSGRENKSITHYSPAAVCGYTTSTGLLNGYATQFDNNKSFSGIDGAVEISVPTDGSAAAATNYKEYTISNCTSAHRLSWHAMQYGYKSWKIDNDYGILYVDNIKVQITQ